MLLKSRTARRVIRFFRRSWRKIRGTYRAPLPVSERKARKAICAFQKWLDKLDFEPIRHRKKDIEIGSLKLTRDIEIRNLHISWWKCHHPHFYFTVNNDFRENLVGGDTFEEVVASFKERMADELGELLRPRPQANYWDHMGVQE